MVIYHTYCAGDTQLYTAVNPDYITLNSGNNSEMTTKERNRFHFQFAFHIIKGLWMVWPKGSFILDTKCEYGNGQSLSSIPCGHFVYHCAHRRRAHKCGQNGAIPPQIEGTVW